MQTAVLDTINDASLRVYPVWVPILETDGSAPDDRTRSLVSDGRAAHFWDPQGMLPRLFSSVLKLPPDYPAWDVYLTYPPGMMWNEEPPEPIYWQHQLGDLAEAPRLDGEAFVAHLGLMLNNQREAGRN